MKARIAPILPILFALSFRMGSGMAMDPAQALFEEGVSLMEKGALEEACPKFEQSLTQTRVAGTLFALADCEDRRGRIATALKRYEEYLIAYAELSDDKKSKHDARATTARSRKEALAPLVPTLTLVLPSSAPANVTITLDNQTLPRTVIGGAIDVNPGEHVIVVRALGTTGTISRVTLGRGDRERVELAVPAVPKAAPARDVPWAPKTTQASDIGLRVGGIVAGGISAGGFVLGAFAGGMALSRKAAMGKDCVVGTGDPIQCRTPEGVNAGNDARNWANMSTAGLAIGAAGAALATTFMVLYAQERAQVSARLKVGPTGASYSLEGVW